MEFFFQPADIVSQILNFGLPAPVDIQIIGADMRASYDIGQKIANRLRQIPGAADVHVQQMLSLPTLHLEMDRTRLGDVGLSAQNVAQSVLISLSGSFADDARLLAQSQERRHLSHRHSIPAISHDLDCRI